MLNLKNFSLFLVLGLLASSTALAAEPTKGKWIEFGSFLAPEANQASASDENYYYAIGSTQIVKYDRRTFERLAVSKGSAEHLNSGFLMDGLLYSAHSNYPKKPDESEIKVLNTETMELKTFHRFEDPLGSLTVAVKEGDIWWCVFAHYQADNPKTLLAKYDENFKLLQQWTFPATVISLFDGMSISGAIWKDGVLLATPHHDLYLFQLKIPAEGSVLEDIGIIESPLPGQGIAFDAESGMIMGIDRPRRHIVFGKYLPAE